MNHKFNVGDIVTHNVDYDRIVTASITGVVAYKSGAVDYHLSTGQRIGERFLELYQKSFQSHSSKAAHTKNTQDICKSCLGKKRLSVYTNQIVTPDFVSDKPYNAGGNEIQDVNCSRCNATGFEPKVDTETKEHNDKVKLRGDIIKFMRKNGYFAGKPGSHKEMKDFLSSIL